MENPFEKKKAKEKLNAATGGSEFEAVADSLTGEQEPPVTAPVVEVMPEDEGERLVIREEWAETGVRLMFLIPVKLDHPAWMPSQEVVRAVAPKLQVIMQKGADQWLPQLLGRFASKNQEFVDLLAALTIAGFQQFAIVQQQKKTEAEILQRKKEEEEQAAHSERANAA